MISLEQTNRSLIGLRTLKFFPADPAVAAQVGRAINEMCQTNEEAQRLTDAMLERHSEWPGIAALKGAYASVTVSSRRADSRCPNCAPGGAAGWREVFIYTDKKTHKEVSREFPDTNLFSADKRRELESAVKRSENHDGYFAMQRCSCPAGRRGAEYDRENEQRYFNPASIYG